MSLIDGKRIASELLEELAEKNQNFPRKIGLAFILVGSYPASQTYVRMKKKACARIGIHSLVVELPQDIPEKDLLRKIEELNISPDFDGILVQLPLPSHLDPVLITRAINPEKDVDGFHPINLGKLLLGEEGGFIPCTPHGIKVLLERSHLSTEGKHVVIIGRSNIVGKPLAALLVQKKPGCNATVTLAHGSSRHLASIAKSADILVAAIGSPKVINASYIKEGAIVIDVGINRVGEQIVGDVDFEAALPLVSKITPVPGGVGPMTIALLLQNTYESARRK